jgi:multidrug transporter EmrE-like cation transporter
LLYLAPYVLLTTTGLVLLRHSLADLARAPFSEYLESRGLILGLLCYTASFVAFLACLRQFRLLTVYPIFTGVAYAAVSLAGVLILREAMTPLRVAGIAFVGVGVVLLTQ